MKKTVETLGERVERLRKAVSSRPSQIEFAEMARTTRRTIQNIENGKTPSPGIDKIQGIARAVELTVSEVLGEEKPIPRDLISRVVEAEGSADQLHLAGLLLERFAAAPPKLRALVLAYLYHDFEIVRKYERELAGLMPKPK